MSQGEAGERLEWTVLPFTENVKRSIVVVMIIVVAGAVVYLGFRDIFLAIISVLILFGSLHTYFTRTTYCLDENGIVIRTCLAKTVKKWSDFKKYYADQKGVTLSPFAGRSRLEPFRSVRLLYGGNRDEVVAFISKNFDGDSASGGP